MSDKNYVLSDELAKMLGITTASLRVTRSRQARRRAEEQERGLPGKYRPTDIPEPESFGRMVRWKRGKVEKWAASQKG